MKKNKKTREQLLKELEKSNKSIAELEKSEIDFKQIEKELKNKEQFLTDVFDSIQDGISILDSELNIITTNRWMERMYADQMPLTGKKCYQVYQRRNSRCPWCPSIKTLEDGKLHTEIVPYPDADNPTGWIDLSAYPFIDNTGMMSGVIEHVKDITERKKAEGQIQFLSSVVKQSADGMAIADMEGNLLFVNDAWAIMHGYDKAEELIGQNLSVFHNKEQLENDVEPFNRKVKEKGYYNGEVGHIRKDGAIFPTQMTTTLLRDENDNPIAIAGVAIDITERKQAENALSIRERIYETLLNNLPGFTYRCQNDENWTMIYISSGCEEITGYLPEDFIN